MTLKIDSAGRITLPKQIRDQLGLSCGGDLDLIETNDGLTLRSVEHRPSLIRKGNFLVHTGELPQGYDILAATANDRGERDRKVWGL